MKRARVKAPPRPPRAPGPAHPRRARGLFAFHTKSQHSPTGPPAHGPRRHAHATGRYANRSTRGEDTSRDTAYSALPAPRAAWSCATPADHRRLRPYAAYSSSTVRGRAIESASSRSQPEPIFHSISAGQPTRFLNFHGNWRKFSALISKRWFLRQGLFRIFAFSYCLRTDRELQSTVPKYYKGLKLMSKSHFYGRAAKTLAIFQVNF